MEVLKTRRDMAPKPFAMFVNGPEFWELVYSFTQIPIINSFSRSNTPPPSDAVIASTTNSDTPIYIWDDGNALKWWCLAEKVYLGVSAQSMFGGYSSLVSLNFSGINTSLVTNMYEMFYNCSALRSLDLSSFDTANVTDMSNMFHSCSAMTSLDISSFNTTNVTDMSGMFYNCQALTTIRASSRFTLANVSNPSYMFFNCLDLVGGAGTAYDANYTDGEYARIDNPPTAPGYFTAAT